MGVVKGDARVISYHRAENVNRKNKVTRHKACTRYKSSLLTMTVSPNHERVAGPIYRVAFTLERTGVRADALILGTNSKMPGSAPANKKGKLFNMAPGRVSRVGERGVILVRFNKMGGRVVCGTGRILGGVGGPIVVVSRCPISFRSFTGVNMGAIKMVPRGPRARKAVIRLVASIVHKRSYARRGLSRVVSGIRGTVVGCNGWIKMGV